MYSPLLFRLLVNTIPICFACRLASTQFSFPSALVPFAFRFVFCFVVSIFHSFLVFYNPLLVIISRSLPMHLEIIPYPSPIPRSFFVPCRRIISGILFFCFGVCLSSFSGRYYRPLFPSALSLPSVPFHLLPFHVHHLLSRRVHHLPSILFFRRPVFGIVVGV